MNVDYSHAPCTMAQEYITVLWHKLVDLKSVMADSYLP